MIGFSITDWYSAVGMFLREALSWVMVSTVLVRFAIYGDSSLVVSNRSRNAGGSFGTAS